MAFNRQKGMECLSVPDERSAGFFALGMAQQIREPVVLICTSGTAALNYAPAVAEAYYQHIPLIVITADRPPEWIDQQDGQAIHQIEVYRNYIKRSFSLPVEILSQQDIQDCEFLISEAFHSCIYPAFGPVHINVPMREPLYKQTEEEMVYKEIMRKEKPLSSPEPAQMKEIIDLWNGVHKKMIITGLLHPESRLNQLINSLAALEDVVVFTETTSNLHGNRLHPCIDRIITAIDDPEKFRPELLLTIGGPLISRKIKTFLRTYKPRVHWNVSLPEPEVNAYLSLTNGIKMDPVSFLEILVQNNIPSKSAYAALYEEIESVCSLKHQAFLETAPFSDLKVFETILSYLPENNLVQLGNSTPVRYAQLFRPSVKTFHFANRGTSGIDGCCSTAAGAAYASKKPTTLITGDIGFFYDSNFLWNNCLCPGFRVIVINNGGGGIFRFIDGPDKTEELDPYIETPHELNTGNIAGTYHIPYFFCDSADTLEKTLPDFYKPSSMPAILEVKTPRLLNGRVLKAYFEHLKE